MKKISFLLALAVLLSFTACQRREGGPLVFSLATASLGGTYYIVGAGLAEVLTNNVPQLLVNAVIAQGSTGNPLMLGRGEVDLAMTNYYSAFNALHGTGIYAATGAIPLAGIAKLQYSILQFMVLADSGIYSVADLRGRGVNIGPAGGGGALLFRELLPFWGLSIDDVNVSFVSYAEGSEALRDGRLEVNVPHGAPPLAAISSVAAFSDVRLLELEEDILQRVIQQYPYYDIAYIPAGTYRGIDRPVRSIGIQDILVVRQDMDEELAFQITKAIYENLAFLRQVHPSLAEMSFDGFRHSLVPLHPGALRFYRERGIPLE